MRYLITGEKGFIATNLVRILRASGHDVVTPDDYFRSWSTQSIIDKEYVTTLKVTGEYCVYRNAISFWVHVFEQLKVDVVVHNAAMVGSDVVHLYPEESTLTNVLGTQIIASAANWCDIPVCYLGTSVIYDTPLYQDSVIDEQSLVKPSTTYGRLKLAGEMIVKSTCKRWSIVRPLFAFGGTGDMNSLIAKGFYAALNGKKVDLFLDPAKVKDYIHVDDFCRAVVVCCEKGLWGEDFNVAAETPRTVGEIVEMMGDTLGDRAAVVNAVKWVRQADYLGNHRMTARKFREASGWFPELSMGDSLARVLGDIRMAQDGSGYNPLRYLEDAKSRGVDLTEAFPTVT